jgi:preprotein translocase subunit YajC
MISISNLFISNAYADGIGPGTGAGITDFLPLFALVAVFYFLILRPQQKRSKGSEAYAGSHAKRR